MALPTFFQKLFSSYGNAPKIKESVTLPAQASQSGKVLTTDGTNSSWGTVSSITTAETDVIQKTSTVSTLSISGGTNTSSGANIILAGKDKASYGGEFWITATDGTNTKVLKGKPDGSLTWNDMPLFPIPNTPEAHTCFYRGKEHTVEGLSAKVLAEDWSDIFIGDYFKVSFTTAYGTVTNEKMLVAGINYFKNCGDTATTVPHLVMIPENGFGFAQMNSTNVTTGGYKGSAMHTTVLPTIATALKTAIGSSHVVSRRYLLSNTVNTSTPSMAGAGYSGASTNWEWVSCDLCLMSEPMVYGATVCSSSLYDVGDRKQQLPIFSLNPQIANTRSYWWLSAVASSADFVHVSYDGIADGYYASYSRVVRPLLVFR